LKVIKEITARRYAALTACCEDRQIRNQQDQAQADE